jgi:Ca2+-binding EF-hand superfamily protein
LKTACSDPKSAERVELNQFLTRCFLDADTDFDGKVRWPTFNFLIDTAMANPRHFGLIASRAERYSSVEEMDESRKKMFKEIDHQKHGFIRLHDWLEFFHSYFGTKLANIDPETTKSKINVSKEKYMEFMVAACTDRRTPEYKEMYRFLLYCFQEGAVDKRALVCADGFDIMVELAATPPRQFGFAPKTAEAFANDAERIASRNALFKTINTTNSGRISFDQWLDYSYKHICEKAALIEPSLSGKPPATVREGVVLE